MEHQSKARAFRVHFAPTVSHGRAMNNASETGRDPDPAFSHNQIRLSVTTYRISEEKAVVAIGQKESLNLGRERLDLGSDLVLEEVRLLVL